MHSLNEWRKLISRTFFLGCIGPLLPRDFATNFPPEVWRAGARMASISLHQKWPVSLLLLLYCGVTQLMLDLALAGPGKPCENDAVVRVIVRRRRRWGVTECPPGGDTGKCCFFCSLAGAVTKMLISFTCGCCGLLSPMDAFSLYMPCTEYNYCFLS